MTSETNERHSFSIPASAAPDVLQDERAANEATAFAYGFDLDSKKN
jgi:hypothetical protein